MCGGSSSGAMLHCSPGKRSRSSDLLAAVEFVSDGSTAAQVVTEFSPCKAQACSAVARQELLPAAAAKLDGAAAAAFRGQLASPTAVADMTAAPSTASTSQPSSATSSLAAALADLQVSSRQSSANDLGDRRALLAQLGIAPRPLAHSRSNSGEELLAAEDSLCSPKLIGAVRSFDSMMLKTLTPIKTRSRATTQAEEPGQPSPPVPYAESLVSPFQQHHQQAASAGMRPKHAGGRPMVYHSRSSSGLQAPGAYNPYDMTAAALSSEFRSPAKSLYSPYTGSSHPPSATQTPTPSQWSASYRAATYRNLAAQHALQAQKEDEPDFYVSVPGVTRRSCLSRTTTGSSASLLTALQQVNTPASAATPGTAGTAASEARGAGALAPAAPAAAPTADPAVQRQQSSGSGSSGSSCATLGSGTAVHGFKGLFRNIIVAGPAGNAASPDRHTSKC